MSLAGGDLTTPTRVSTWMANPPSLPSPILSQLITSATNMIYTKLNRSRIFNQTFNRTFDGLGNMQLVLPDFPVTSVTSVQVGQRLIPASVIPAPGATQPSGTSLNYGYRFVPWDGNLPGQNAVLEFANGFFWQGAQNVKVIYTAGYLISNESWTVPTTAPYQITVNQFQGIWSKDHGVTYSNGTALTPVTTITGPGQYIVGPDTTPGLYTFDALDAGASILISYSFIPSDLEEACIQLVAERYAYRTRVGDISKSLGGQETMRFWRGGLPPEVESMINPYINVVYPNIGAPL